MHNPKQDSSSFGSMSREEFFNLKDSSHGSFKLAVNNKYDPYWGNVFLDEDGNKLEAIKTFLVEVREEVIVSSTRTAEVEVEAPSEADARKIIDRMDWDGFDWCSNYDETEDTGTSEIISVTEI